MTRLMLSIVLAGMLCSAQYSTVPSPVAPGQRVNDFARVMPSDAESMLEREIRDFEDRTGVQLAVVTAQSLYGTSPENYARAVMSQWGVGHAAANNGIVLLFAPIERKVQVQVGSGLVAHLSKRQTDEVIRGVISPRWKSGNQVGAITGGTREIMAVVISSGYVYSNSNGGPSALQPQANGGPSAWPPQANGGAAPQYSEQDGEQADPPVDVPWGIIVAALSVIGAALALAVVRSRSRNKAKLREGAIRDFDASNLLYIALNDTLDHPDVLLKRRTGHGELGNMLTSYDRSALAGLSGSELREAATQLEKLKSSLEQLGLEVGEDKRNAETARERGPYLFGRMPARFDEAEERLRDDRVQEVHRTALADLRRRWHEVGSGIDPEKADWVKAYPKLAEFEESLKNLESAASRDVQSYEDAKRETAEQLELLRAKIESLEGRSDVRESRLGSARSAYAEAVSLQSGGALDLAHFVMLQSILNSGLSHANHAVIVEEPVQTYVPAVPTYQPPVMSYDPSPSQPSSYGGGDASGSVGSTGDL